MLAHFLASRATSAALPIVLACAALALLAPSARAADFGATGSVQTWTVPAGVTSISVVAIGGAGSDGSGHGGGKGTRPRARDRGGA